MPRVSVTASGKIIPDSTTKAGRHHKLSPPRPRRVRQRKPRCDCGQLAIKILLVRVGTDPQYTVPLPLCQECLTLEENLRDEGLI